MAKLYLHERVYRYAERKFQESGKTEFPTVRQVARALKVKQSDIQDAVDDEPYDNLMLTSFYTKIPELLGDHFVETFEKEDK